MSFHRWIKKIISQKNVNSFNQGKLFVLLVNRLWEADGDFMKLT